MFYYSTMILHSNLLGLENITTKFSLNKNSRHWTCLSPLGVSYTLITSTRLYFLCSINLTLSQMLFILKIKTSYSVGLLCNLSHWFSLILAPSLKSFNASSNSFKKMRISYLIYLNIFRYFPLHYDSFCICITMMLLSFVNTKQPRVLFPIFSHFHFKSSSDIATSINSYGILLRSWEIVQKYMIHTHTHMFTRYHFPCSEISLYMLYAKLLWSIPKVSILL